MARYSYDPVTRTLFVAWNHQTVGALTAPVVSTPGDAVDVGAALGLAAELSHFSDEAWALYEDLPDILAAAAQRPRRGGDPKFPLAAAGGLVRFPPPASRGEECPLTEAAASVGYALDALPRRWRERVAAEVETETDAVLRADASDFTGRACQAVWCNRTEVAPSVLAAAVGFLAGNGDPFDLPARFGPAAATAAGLLWLASSAYAATKPSVAAAGDPARLFGDADEVYPCDPGVMTDLVEAVGAAARKPDEVVRDVVGGQGWTVLDLWDHVADGFEAVEELCCPGAGGRNAWRALVRADFVVRAAEYGPPVLPPAPRGAP